MGMSTFAFQRSQRQSPVYTLSLKTPQPLVACWQGGADDVLTDRSCASNPGGGDPSSGNLMSANREGSTLAQPGKKTSKNPFLTFDEQERGKQQERRWLMHEDADLGENHLALRTNKLRRDAADTKLVWESKDPELLFEDVMYHNEYARDMSQQQRARREAQESANLMRDMSLRGRPKDLHDMGAGLRGLPKDIPSPSELLSKSVTRRHTKFEVGLGSKETGAGPQSRGKRAENVVSCRNVKLIKSLQDDLKSSNWIERERAEQEAAKKAQDELTGLFGGGRLARKASIAPSFDQHASDDRQLPDHQPQIDHQPR